MQHGNACWPSSRSTWAEALGCMGYMALQPHCIRPCVQGPCRTEALHKFWPV